MDMAASANGVARAFVKQYYTVLNKAPKCLHRFFLDDSSFFHGESNEPIESIVGQAQIFKHIQKLDLTECRAKILLIDSQQTVNDGVFIQVTGEISKQCGPMRRFMQSFVLMPQEENKYYVHNDIFRYQDQVFGDVDDDPDQPSTNGYAEDCDTPLVDNETHMENSHYNVIAVSEPSEPVHMNGLAEEEPEMISYLENSIPENHVDLVQPDHPYQSPQDPLEEEEAAPVVAPQEPEPICEPSPPAVPALSPPPQKQEKKEPVAPPAPRSYAGFFKTPVSAPAAAPAPQYQAPPPVTEAPATRSEQPSRGSRRGAAVNGNYRPRHYPAGEPAEEEGEWRQDGGRGRRSESYPDTQQIFVGNLPHNMSEEELGRLFEKYGQIVEVRINTGKSKPGTSAPNFGFITFSEPHAVRSCMNDKPIVTDQDHRLNVEEKKQRSRTDSGFSRRGGASMGGRGGYGGGARMGGRGNYGGGPRR